MSNSPTTIPQHDGNATTTEWMQECPSLASSGLQLSTTDTSVNTVVSLSCDEFGHTPSGGVRALICGSDGHWSHAVPECTWSWELNTHEKVLMGITVGSVFNFIINILWLIWIIWYIWCLNGNFRKRNDASHPSNDIETAESICSTGMELTRRGIQPSKETFLPQDDPNPTQREKEGEETRRLYTLRMPYHKLKDERGHHLDFVMCGLIPDRERFTTVYDKHLGVTLLENTLASLIERCRHKSNNWASFDDLFQGFQESGFPIPTGYTNWDQDSNFGALRLQGANPSTLYLLKDVNTLHKINFPVTDDMVDHFLENKKLTEAVAKKLLFYTDLCAVEGCSTKEHLTLCAPKALFYQHKSKGLIPVAIQLHQQPAPDNPIFTPACETNLWTLVKMWYNNADAAYHEAITHLGCTHIAMEGMSVVTNQCLNESHHVYNLLAPHFQFLIAIDHLAKKALINKHGFVEKVMTSGRNGILQILNRALHEWRLDTDGSLPADLKRRGLEDPNTLPKYYFRDDALLLWDAIEKYVSEYLLLHYPKEKQPHCFTTDPELQNWAKSIVAERKKEGGGLGMKGVPGNGTINNIEDLKSICTSVIYTASVSHAAANFPQYNQYAFVPNYPCQLLGKPPTDTKQKVTKQDLYDALPTRHTTLAMWVLMDLLSQKDTTSLGYPGKSRIDYVPIAKPVLSNFRERLKTVGGIMKMRNEYYKYDYLDPNHVPNSISI